MEVVEMKGLIIEPDLLRRAVYIEMLQYYSNFTEIYDAENITKVTKSYQDLDFVLVDEEYVTNRWYQDVRAQNKEIYLILLSRTGKDSFHNEQLFFLEKPLTIEKVKQCIAILRNQVENIQQFNDTIIHSHVLPRAEFMSESLKELKWRTKKVKELFYYLYHFKDTKYLDTLTISRRLWPTREVEAAKGLLHTTVYQLRKTLEQHGIRQAITFKNRMYHLEIDVRTEVERIYEQMKLPRSENVVRRVRELYKGEYLQEENYIWAAPFRKQFHREVEAYLSECDLIEKEDEYVHPSSLEKSISSTL